MRWPGDRYAPGCAAEMCGRNERLAFGLNRTAAGMSCCSARRLQQKSDPNSQQALERTVSPVVHRLPLLVDEDSDTESQSTEPEGEGKARGWDPSNGKLLAAAGKKRQAGGHDWQEASASLGSDELRSLEQTVATDAWPAALRFCDDPVWAHPKEIGGGVVRCR